MVMLGEEVGVVAWGEGVHCSVFTKFFKIFYIFNMFKIFYMVALGSYMTFLPNLSKFSGESAW